MKFAFISALMCLRAFCQPSLDGPEANGFNLSHAAVTPPTFVRAFTNSIASGTSVTITSADCSGGNWIVIAVCIRNSGTPRTVSGVTVNGVSAQKSVQVSVSSVANVSLWSLQSPATGDIVATLNASAANGLAIAAILFSGASATNATATDPHTSGATSTSVTVNPTTTGDQVIDVIGWLTASGVDVSSAQTVRAIATNATSLNASLILSTKTGAAGSTTSTGSATGAGPTGIGQAGLELVGQ